MYQVIDVPQNLDLQQPLSKIRKDVIMAFAVIIECKFILLGKGCVTISTIFTSMHHKPGTY